MCFDADTSGFDLDQIAERPEDAPQQIAAAEAVMMGEPIVP